MLAALVQANHILPLGSRGGMRLILILSKVRLCHFKFILGEFFTRLEPTLNANFLEDMTVFFHKEP